VTGEPETAREGLARCAGYRVVARDGPAGVVETPLFPPDRHEPDYIVLRIPRGARTYRPVVPASLFAGVDRGARSVSLRARGADLAALPEHLPLARIGAG
jgi:hypothetical protein